MLNLFPTQPSRAAQLPRVDVIIGRGVAQQRVRTIVPPVFVIGTRSDCDLVLTDQQFAEYHAYIMVAEDRVMLRHLGGDPEITVNRRLVRWSELVHGDRLRMGPYEFSIRIWPAASNPMDELKSAKPLPSVEQQLGDYEPPPGLSWSDHSGLADSWAHVLPSVNRLKDW